MENLYFGIAVSFLFIHELDAIKAREWKLFIFLKDMSEDKAYSVWLALHFPLFLFPMMIYSKFFSPVYQYRIQFGFDIFLIAHLFLHILFRKNKSYYFTLIQSNIYILLTALFAIADIVSLKG
ncbi:MAG TPA: hypothetical protein PK079_12155 [Leptospiraceae bacterium]|nr:hypothetical protein [Leptospiraceae bacterium]HMW06549.1 hypothetical protein [Leptospiraceae bacterium]HMX35241.1 hypothetical protein [Leptospiraceae bacterium]HMY31261.1 hypothetical protein [Leptospiraceae bacterium]HMZ67264.1 hypothetical protein [Leptospiraceae bacterium]